MDGKGKNILRNIMIIMQQAHDLKKEMTKEDLVL